MSCSLGLHSGAVLSTHEACYSLQGVLVPAYDLYADGKTGVRYTVPSGADIDNYRKAIEGLPDQESPEIFGLHPNADLTFRSLQV